MITNGTLIERHRDTILAAQPSYFDISLDGLAEDHDAVRGHGAFAQAWPNILWAAQAFEDRFFINLTLQRRNARRIAETVLLLNEHGVRNVELGFYIPLAYTASELALSDPDVEAIFSGLTALGSIPLQHPLRVHLDLDIIGLPALLAFLRSDWFSNDQIREDANGELFVEHVLPNRAVLDMRLAPYPTGIWRSVRITPEGTYLAAEDTVDTRGYPVRSLGNVRDYGFDFGSLHAQARSSTRFRQMLRAYYDELLPLLISAAEKRPIDRASVSTRQHVVAA